MSITPSRNSRASPRRPTGSRRKRGSRRKSTFLAALRPRLKHWRMLRRWLNLTPPPLRLGLLGAAALMVFAAANLVYHVAKKPTEMLWPVSGVLKKAPAETWRDYGSLFRANATASVSPELLAALAQVEGAGDPLAQTYWRWRFSWNPFAVYAPASSAVGMYQMTDPAFAEARHYCIRRHAVVAGCWFDALYSRLLPGDAVELAAVFLDRNIAAILAQMPRARANARQREDLAAVIHLCGASIGAEFARRGFRLLPGERCGDHAARIYVDRVRTMRSEFARLDARLR
jgi:hypothetical protein